MATTMAGAALRAFEFGHLFCASAAIFTTSVSGSEPEFASEFVVSPCARLSDAPPANELRTTTISTGRSAFVPAACQPRLRLRVEHLSLVLLLRSLLPGAKGAGLRAESCRSRRCLLLSSFAHRRSSSSVGRELEERVVPEGSVGRHGARARSLPELQKTRMQR